MVGTTHLACVSIDGFPLRHRPNIIAALSTLPTAYRFSQRMIYLDSQHAVKETMRIEKHWGQKVRGLASAILAQHNAPVNEHAAEMRADARSAASLAESGEGRFGWYSATIVLRHDDPQELEQMARFAERAVNDCGFGARIETTNTIETCAPRCQARPRPTCAAS